MNDLTHEIDVLLSVLDTLERTYNLNPIPELADIIDGISIAIDRIRNMEDK